MKKDQCRHDGQMMSMQFLSVFLKNMINKDMDFDQLEERINFIDSSFVEDFLTVMNYCHEFSLFDMTMLAHITGFDFKISLRGRYDEMIAQSINRLKNGWYHQPHPYRRWP